MKPPPKLSLDNLDQLESWLHDLWKFVELGSCKMNVVTYTGDGATSKAITGVGFESDLITIITNLEGSEANTPIFTVTSSHTANYCIRHAGAGGHDEIDNRIISIDSDGFTVDDDGADAHPNKNGSKYIAVCFKK